MDKLTIFGGSSEVNIRSEENNTLDTVTEKLDDIKTELELTRKGHEAMTWGEEVRENEDVDLEEESEEL